MPVLREPRRLSPRRRKLLLRGYGRAIISAIIADMDKNGPIAYDNAGYERTLHICQTTLERIVSAQKGNHANRRSARHAGN